MEIGNQIKALRARRGVTQETVAEALGVLPQTVSKWETGATAPDIGLLPEISAYFGVTIDQLFALTDGTRMERIRNMLWDKRDIEDPILEREAEFLRDMTRREPKNGEPWTLLAWMENFQARAHHRRAEAYAKEALARTPDSRDAHGELAEAVGILSPDWYSDTHWEYIGWYEDFITRNPTVWRAYLWIMDALIADRRFDEAEVWCEKLAQINDTFRVPDYRARIALARGDRARAREIRERMVLDFPDDWMAWTSLGDNLVFDGEYDRALECYREAQRRQTHPRAFTDPFEAIAQTCERMGNIPAAIEALEREIEAMGSDWDTTDGETVDAVRREIERLRRKL